MKRLIKNMDLNSIVQLSGDYKWSKILEIDKKKMEIRIVDENGEIDIYTDDEIIQSANISEYDRLNRIAYIDENYQNQGSHLYELIDGSYHHCYQDISAKGLYALYASYRKHIKQ